MLLTIICMTLYFSFTAVVVMIGRIKKQNSLYLLFHNQVVKIYIYFFYDHIILQLAVDICH